MFVVGYELILVAEVQVVAEPLLDMAMVSGWNSPIGQSDTVVLRAPNKMIVAPRASVFASGKEGEAGHPRMVDGA